MTTIKCPECGFDISEIVEICPECGFPLQENTSIDHENETKYIRCPECGKSVDAKAVTCSECGFSIREIKFDQSIESEPTKKSKVVPVTLGVVVLLLICIYTFTGFFVIQPIGAVPDGVTIWYVRSGTQMPFVSSADGLLIQQGTPVSLLTRGVVLGGIADNLNEKTIARLPYMEFLYLMSTNGQQFER